MLLARGLVRLLVIDSVAAPFRCEFPAPDAAPRARLLRALGAALRRLSCTFQSPVLCINQASPRVGPGGAGRGSHGHHAHSLGPAGDRGYGRAGHGRDSRVSMFTSRAGGRAGGPRESRRPVPFQPWGHTGHASTRGHLG